MVKDSAWNYIWFLGILNIYGDKSKKQLNLFFKNHIH